MASKHYNKFFTDARELAMTNASLMGRAMLPADEITAIDQIYLRWVADGNLDGLLLVIEGLFTELAVINGRIQFVADFRLELESRNDRERLHQLFERTIRGAWKRYQLDSKPRNRLYVGNIARSALWKADILQILYEYIYSATFMKDTDLIAKIKEQAISFYYNNKFDPNLKSWRSEYQKGA